MKQSISVVVVVSRMLMKKMNPSKSHKLYGKREKRVTNKENGRGEDKMLTCLVNDERLDVACFDGLSI